MEFIDSVKQFSARAAKLKEQCATEEATKMALVVPLLKILGYDVYNPEEVVPEYTADVPGLKKDEKVDYAVIRDGQPAILIEVKGCRENLKNHSGQLFRYFTATAAKFGILTNGLIYRFYTDLDEPNKMDQMHYFEFNILNLRDSDIEEFKKFHKDAFCADDAFDMASELKYSNAIKSFFYAQLKSPTDSFVRYILSEIYSGKRTQAILERFAPIIRESLNDFVNEKVKDTLSAALRNGANQDVPAGKAEDLEDDWDDDDSLQDVLVPTEEEMQCYYIIKAILGRGMPLDRITYKKTASYFKIKVDGKVTWWICRFFIKEKVRFVQIPNDNRKAIRYDFKDVTALYALDSEIIARAMMLAKK